MTNKRPSYPVFFENSNNQEHFIAEVSTLDEAFSVFKDFCDQRNFKMYYINFYIEDCLLNDPEATSPVWRMTFDVGSWSEFFHIYFNTRDEATAFRDFVPDEEKPF